MSSYFPVRSGDLAIAWGRAFAALAAPGVDEISPLVVNISGFEGGFPSENTVVRTQLEDALERCAAEKRAREERSNLCLPETTANLIFPEQLWFRYRAVGRATFFDRYLQKVLPRLKKRDRRNSKGTYFSRLISYGADSFNQLEHVLEAWDAGTRRRSAMQIVIFDPAADHSRQPFLGFPCLDYLTFTPNTKEKTLSVTAMYAEQYLFERGYGNYLGLCRLGRFVAEQMNLRFDQFTCVTSCAKLGDTLGKREAQSIAERIKSAIEEKGA